MTLSEFKAWFEGFNENLEGRPNVKQWKRIQARIKDIDGEPVTSTVIREYVDRYIPRRPYTYWYDDTYWGTSTVSFDSTSQTTFATNSINTDGKPGFGDATITLAAMGAEEAASLM